MMSGTGYHVSPDDIQLANLTNITTLLILEPKVEKICGNFKSICQESVSSCFVLQEFVSD